MWPELPVRETGLGITLSRKGDREDRKVHSGFYSQISCLCAWTLESGNFFATVVTGRGAWEDASPHSKRAAGFASAAGGTPESPSLSDPQGAGFSPGPGEAVLSPPPTPTPTLN